MKLLGKIIMFGILFKVFGDFVEWRTIKYMKPDTVYITKIDTLKLRYYVMDSLVFKHNGKKVTKVYHGGK